MRATRWARILLLTASMLPGASSVLAQSTELLVYQVQAAQLPGTGLVDVWYRLHTVGDGPVTVRLHLSTDGGLSYPHLCQTVTGDVGPGVLPGTSRHLVWNAGADFPGFSSTTCLLRVTADDGVYELADLAGIWESHGIALDGPGAPWWTWSVDAVAADGTYAGGGVSSDTGGYAESGSLALTPQGILTLPGSTEDFLGALDTDRDVFVMTGTWDGSPDAGTTELMLGVRQGSAYGLPDLVGRWVDNRIASVPGAPWWERGELLIAADGSFSAQVSESGGSPQTITGTFGGLTPDGVLVFDGGDPEHRAVMDAGKTVMVGTATWDSGTPGTAELSIDVKMADSYSQPDLQGTWVVHSVSSGSGPWWFRGTAVIGADGAFTISATESGGGTSTESGQFVLAADGIVTFPGHAVFRGALDAGRTVLVATNSWPDGASEMTVAVRIHD